MKDTVYLNGSFVDRAKAFISPFDHGFLYGYGVFETMRAYKGRFFRLEAHLDRLYHSLEKLRVDHPLTPPEFESVLYRLLEMNGLKEARVRITVSAGAAEATPEPVPTTPTVFVAVRPFTPFPEEAYRNGYRAITTSLTANRLSPLSQVKSCNYLSSLIARREAHSAGVQEALFLNDRRHLVEGSVSNLFVIRDGKIITPPLSSGALPGITRAVVLELALALGLTAAEQEISYSELAGTQEAFVTSSIIEVMPLVSVDGKPIGTGAPGEVTGRIMAAYRRLVEEEAGTRNVSPSL